MSGSIKWSPQQVELLKKLWHEGVSSLDIALKLGKSACSVRGYVSRNRKSLGLEKRQDAHNLHLRPRSVQDFERQWIGSVPFGHWMITKPWKTQK